MKKIAYLSTLLISLSVSTFVWSAQESSPLLVIDAKNTSTLPRNYRQCTDAYLADRVQQIEDHGIEVPSTDGLSDLNISGSAQFSQKQLEEILKLTPGEVYIVDLREESHGYLDGDAISWYQGHNDVNKGLTLKEIMAREGTLIGKLCALKTVVVHEIMQKVAQTISQVNAISLPVNSAMSETKLARLERVHYIRFPVTDHHPPSPKILAQFVSFYKNLPPKAHLILHCRGGKGRTTFFMAVCDILKNGHQVSLEDILLRQYLLGGRYMLVDPKPDRYVVLKSFYEQVTNTTAGTN